MAPVRLPLPPKLTGIALGLTRPKPASPFAEVDLGAVMEKAALPKLALLKTTTVAFVIVTAELIVLT
jgi:hypothetical protein